MSSSVEAKTYTYQARIEPAPDVTDCLNAMAKLLGKVERKLYKSYRKGVKLNSLKSYFLAHYGISARQFNAIRINLEGKIKSVLSLQDSYIQDIKIRITKTQKTIKSLSKRQTKAHKIRHKLHQAKRLLPRLNIKLSKLEQDKKSKTARICFASKKLFRKQFNLQTNNIESHAKWKEQWDFARNNQFYLVGSKDETAGNQSCVATLNDKGNIDLKVRVPDYFADKFNKYIEIKDIHFAYGHDEIVAAISENNKRNSLQKKTNQKLCPELFKRHGQAINYRFLCDNKGWRVFITTEKRVVMQQEQLKCGAIGLDLNAEHIAVTEVDRTGNPVYSFNVPLCTYGKSENQAQAIIGDAIKTIVLYAAYKNKPIVIEKLDFSKKKQELSKSSPKAARALSSFAYSSIIKAIKSRSFKYGIKVYEINPAYSSIIGRVKFARLYKLSVHQAAALVIARRILNYSERLPRYWDNIPDNMGHRVTLPELVKIQGKHVWSSWSVVLKSMKTVLAAQYQMVRESARQTFLIGEQQLSF